MDDLHARVRQLFAERRGGEALRQLRALDAESGSQAELERCIAASLQTDEQRRHSYADLRDDRGYQRGSVLSAAETLARRGWFGHALALLELAHAPGDPSVAHQRARWAMRAGDYAQVVTAAECAIESMLRVRMPFESFLARALAGVPPEQLLCFSRADIARLARLRMPFVLCWEASHRLGKRTRAAKLRELCLAFWPERRSVWESAGQHALDAGQADAADAYFARALALDAGSITALAGRAIAREMHKDWHGALVLRAAIADRTDAWRGTDAASLHRVLRYAANLGRLGRWEEAAPHFASAWRAGAARKLPPERRVLLRIFADELYAPAAVADLLAEAPELARRASPDVARALRDALRLAQLARRAAVEIDEPFQRALALGMLASQAGDPVAALACFGAALALEPADVVAGYLAASTARYEAAVVNGSAGEARAVGWPAGLLRERSGPTATLSATAQYFAALAQLVEHPARPARPMGVAHLDALLARVHAARAAAACDGVHAARGGGRGTSETDGLHAARAGARDASASDGLPACVGVRDAAASDVWEHVELASSAPTELFAQLLSWTALREACIAAGQPPYVAARVCARVRHSMSIAMPEQVWDRSAWCPAWRDVGTAAADLGDVTDLTNDISQ